MKSEQDTPEYREELKRIAEDYPELKEFLWVDDDRNEDWQRMAHLKQIVPVQEVACRCLRLSAGDVVMLDYDFAVNVSWIYIKRKSLMEIDPLTCMEQWAIPEHGGSTSSANSAGRRWMNRAKAAMMQGEDFDTGLGFNLTFDGYRIMFIGS